MMDPERRDALRAGKPFGSSSPAEDTDDAKLRDIQHRLAERNGHNADGPRRLGTASESYRAGSETPHRPGGGREAREGTSQVNLDYAPRTPREHGVSLGTIRAKPRSEREDGVGAKGVRKAPASAGRPSARQEVSGGLEGVWNSVKGPIQKALAYAGFDVTGDAQSLSAIEAEALIPKFEIFIQSVGAGLDWALTHANARHEESDVWQFDDNEVRVLALIWVKRARKVAWMAEVTRQVQHISDVGDIKDIGFIVGKRVVASGTFLASNGGVHPWLR